MRIWAIGDLHLGFSTGKWMDGFGAHWLDHARKVAERWTAKVSPEDLVILAGDLSWAMKPEEARPDMEWLGRLPGKKVLVKGNHDYWWPPSKARMRELLPPGSIALKRNAAVVDGVPLIGVRGADFFPPEEATAEGAEALERERHELQLSIDNLRTLGPVARPPIAVFHYPPFPLDSCESVFTGMLEAAGVRTCVYGHLHQQVDWERAFQGEYRGVTYRLVSCDFLDFSPLRIEG
jgi:uncharacterized protein